MVAKLPQECWEWPGPVDKCGYGRVMSRGVRDFLHRVVWRGLHGEIPSGMVIMHRCDNPACCNPHHLVLGTPEDNWEDMRRKGRNRGPVSRELAATIARSELTSKEICAKYCVAKGTVEKIRAGKHWSQRGQISGDEEAYELRPEAVGDAA